MAADREQNNYHSISLSSAVRDDFIETYGWSGLIKNLGSERPGTKDAWNAIKFASAKGSSGTTCTLRFHKALVNPLISMLEVRWADHFSMQSPLEAPYDRAIDRLKAIRSKVKRK